MSDTSDGAGEQGVLRMKFQGGRFDSHAFPATALPEIRKLSKLFTRLAEVFWKQENPDRQRVPKGFSKNFELFLSDVRPGSAIPVLFPGFDAQSPPGEYQNQGSLFDFEGIGTNEKYLTSKSARVIEEAFISIVQSNHLPAEFPQEARRDVTQLFSSLSNDEFPVFWNSANQEFYYTADKRARYTNSQSAGTTIGTGQIAGRLASIDVDARKIYIKLADGSEIPATYMPDMVEDARGALALPRETKRVVALGPHIKRNGKIVEIVEVEELIPIDLPEGALGDRLEQLLTDDLWGECNSVAPVVAALIQPLLQGLVTENGPAIFPLSDGGVQLVWRIDGARTTVEVADSDQISARQMSLKDRGHRVNCEWRNLEDARVGISQLLG